MKEIALVTLRINLNIKKTYQYHCYASLLTIQMLGYISIIQKRATSVKLQLLFKVAIKSSNLVHLHTRAYETQVVSL